MAKVMMKGNVAAAEAAIRGGMEFFAGYPIIIRYFWLLV